MMDGWLWIAACTFDYLFVYCGEKLFMWRDELTGMPCAVSQMYWYHPFCALLALINSERLKLWVVTKVSVTRTVSDAHKIWTTSNIHPPDTCCFYLKGVAVTNLHHVNDALWNAGSMQEASNDIPPEALKAELEFQENQVRDGARRIAEGLSLSKCLPPHHNAVAWYPRPLHW